MPTVWSPAPYIQKQEWLLDDGSIVVSPDFETTSSGRRVRVAGTTASFGNKQVDALIERSIDTLATQRGAKKVMRLFSDAENDERAAAHAGITTTVFTDAVTLHMLTENYDNRYGGSTTAVWKFQVPNTPIFAYVFITLTQRQQNYAIQPHLVFRNIYPGHGVNSSYYVYDESTGANSPTLYRYSTESEAIAQWCRENFSIPDVPFKEQSYNGQMRTAVVRFAEMCKKFDSLSEITVPDMRKGPDDLETFTMRPVASNYSASFHNELLSFVQTGPILDRIKETYKALMRDFKILGLITSHEADDNAFAAAINGNKSALKCTLSANEDADVRDGGVDPYHTVVLDFASGSVVVNCSHNSNINETAEAWEIAKFKAEVAGEVDVLLEYAKAYQNPKEQKRLLKIIGQRSAPET